MLTYLPKLKINEYAMEQGVLDKKEEYNINEGLQGNYMDVGSNMEKDRRKLMETYKLFFRLMSFMPKWMKQFVYKTKIYHMFYYLPFDIILRFFDLSMVIRDYDANAYARNYWWWFTKRFNPKHPSYYLNRLGTKNSRNSQSKDFSLKLGRIEDNASADL